MAIIPWNVPHLTKQHPSSFKPIPLFSLTNVFIVLTRLDEPTNHLDIDAVLFLDDHLATKWKGTILTVSHDCDFLDSICTNIMHIDDQKINYYAGNVTSFEKMKHQILAKKVKSFKLQQKTIKEFTSAPQGLTVEKARKRTMEKLGRQ